MRPIYQFIIGSQVFFKDLEDFTPKDKDVLCIMDRFNFKGNVLHGHLQGDDVFFFRNMDKDGFINDALESKVPMRLGKFLVPEFATHINLEINDLKKLSPLAENLDEKHKYEKIIYDSYLENNDFVLTEEQRLKAFKSYKDTRKS